MATQMQRVSRELLLVSSGVLVLGLVLRYAFFSSSQPVPVAAKKDDDNDLGVDVTPPQFPIQPATPTRPSPAKQSAATTPVVDSPVLCSPSAPAAATAQTEQHLNVTKATFTALFKLAGLSKPADTAAFLLKNGCDTVNKLGKLTKQDLARITCCKPADVTTMQTKIIFKIKSDKNSTSSFAPELVAAEKRRDLKLCVMLTLMARTAAEAGAGCCAIGNLADDNQDELGRLGACEAVVAAISRFGTADVQVTQLGCGAIGMLARYHDDNQSRMNQLGACELVLGCMSRYGRVDQKVAQRVCLTVFILAADQANAQTLAEAGACEAVIEALGRFGTQDVELAQYGLGSIQHLSEDDAIKIRLVKLKACELIVAILTRYGTTVLEVAREGCGAIQNFAADSSGRIQFLLGKCGACEQVVNALVKFGPKDEILTQFACGAVQNLSVYDDNQAYFGKAGACEAVLAALRAHGKRDGNAAYFGCAAIKHLAVNEENKEKLNQLGAAEVIKACQDNERQQEALAMLA